MNTFTRGPDRFGRNRATRSGRTTGNDDKSLASVSKLLSHCALMSAQLGSTELGSTQRSQWMPRKKQRRNKKSCLFIYDVAVRERYHDISLSGGSFSLSRIVLSATAPRSAVDKRVDAGDIGLPSAERSRRSRISFVQATNLHWPPPPARCDVNCSRFYISKKGGDVNGRTITIRPE